MKNILKTESNDKLNDFISYSKHEIQNYKNGKVRIVKNKKDIENFIRMSTIFSSNKKLYYGKIGKNISNKIASLAVTDTYLFNISLSVNAVRHILKNHGNDLIESHRGQIAVAEDDFKLILKIISESDTIKINSDSVKSNVVVIFRTTIESVYYLVCYISNKKHNLEIKTMWKIKKK